VIFVGALLLVPWLVCIVVLALLARRWRATAWIRTQRGSRCPRGPQATAEWLATL
jgi:hypothetical protein